ncbi:MAG: helical backbone metal receptor [Planctomycetota bacterium]
MRVLSLCPSITETLFALGLEPAEGHGTGIVGRTKFCVEPSARVAALPVVGGTKDPRLERILELAPDLVLMNEEENRREDAEALAAAGVALHTSLPVDVPSTARALESIGTAVGRPGPAADLARDLTARAAQIEASLADAAPVRFAYLIWRGPWMAAGPGTYVDALLKAAGGTNVLGRGPIRYPEVGLASLADRGIDRVLLSSEPFPFTARHLDEVRAALGSEQPAIDLVDGRLLSWHGVSTLDGLPYARRVLAGGDA